MQGLEGKGRFDWIAAKAWRGTHTLCLADIKLFAFISLAFVGSCDDSNSPRILLQYTSFGGDLFGLTQSRPRQAQLRPPGSSVFVGAVDSAMRLEIRSGNSLSDLAIMDNNRLFVVERTSLPQADFRLLEVHLQENPVRCDIVISGNDAITSPFLIPGERQDRLLYFSGPYQSESQGTPVNDMKLTEHPAGSQLPMVGPKLGLPTKLNRLDEDTLLVLAYQSAGNSSNGTPASSADDIIQKHRFGPRIFAVDLRGNSYSVKLLASPTAVPAEIDDVSASYQVVGLAAEPRSGVIVVEHFDPSKRTRSNDGFELSYYNSKTLDRIGNVKLPGGFQFGEPYFVSMEDGNPVVRLAAIQNGYSNSPDRISIFEIDQTFRIVSREVEVKSSPVLETSSCSAP